MIMITAQKRILIIDDEEVTAKAFAQRLEKRGFAATVLNDSRLAEGLLERESFDLIVMDILMPQIDGISLLKTIRKTYSYETLPVLMMTIVEESDRIFEAFKAGANDYVNKPIHIDAAVARIMGQLSTVELQRAHLQKKELEAMNTLVLTCHHKINNPLAIALLEANELLTKNAVFDSAKVKNIRDMLTRIKDTISEIKTIVDAKKINFELYAGNSKMVKLSK